MNAFFRKISVLCLMVCLVILGAGIGTPSFSSEVRIGDGKGDWGYPNPYRHYPRGPGYVRMSLVFDSLIWKDANGYIPCLAKTWSFDQEKMAFTFDLDPRAKWHDGKPLTAEDVVFSLEYYKKHPYSWITVDAVSHSEAVGPHKVIITLSRGYSPFLSDIGGTMVILPKHIWESVDDPKTFNDPKAFIGSGPYMFKDFNKAQGTYLYEAFADYHLGAPKADRLIYVKSKKPLLSLMNGEVDLANIKPEMADTLKKKGMVIISDERGWNKKLMINHKKFPFSDKGFRHALAHAVSQQEIIDKAHRGFAFPASYGLLSKDHEMYNPKTPVYSYDPEKAAALIQEIGFKKGADGYFAKDGKPLEIELLSSNITVAGETVADRDGEVIKKQLEAVGIKVNLVNLEQATTDSRVKNWDFDLAVSGHGGICGDARILNEMISSKFGAGSVNSARYDANPELEQLQADQMLEMDPDKRKAIVFKIQALYAEDLPAISLYSPDSKAAYNPEKGITWYYTKGGISKGIPIPQNKMSLIK